MCQTVLPLYTLFIHYGLTIFSYLTYLSGSGLSTLACSQMIGSTPNKKRRDLNHRPTLSWNQWEDDTNMRMKNTRTCRSILQQLFELCRRQLCACDGHGHSNLWELDLDVALLQKNEECGGGDPLGGAIKGTLHHINDHLGPKGQRTHQRRPLVNNEMIIIRICLFLFLENPHYLH